MERPSFRKQIEEDIRDYQEANPYIHNMQKDEWAFNYWILDRLYCEDEDEILNKIIDYRDYGVDCFVWHEETKDLYLIQNKYYKDASSIDASYIKKTLNEAWGHLSQGSFDRSAELQGIFNKYRDDPNFFVHHYFYIANDRISDESKNVVSDFNVENINRDAAIFDLNEIEKAYYGEPITDKRALEVDIQTVNKGTRITIHRNEYKMDVPIDGTYAMVPISNLYLMMKKAKEVEYPIFDANIREYLGSGGRVNKRIIQTLKSSEDRNNFFFYNNGITIICDAIKDDRTVGGSESSSRQFTVVNPQIVNGCQTVSSITHVLQDEPEDTLEETYKNVFVMAKILELPEEDEKSKELRENIVRYNNSQNGIDEKSFEALNDKFKRIQLEFEKRGFLLLLKQSDSQKYRSKYKDPSKLIEKSEKLLKKFNLIGAMKKTSNFEIKLEKLLQVILAFYGDSKQAFQKKGNLLKRDSPQYQLVTDALTSPELTIERLLNLYLLYLKSEKEKKDNIEDGKVPITWYMIESIAEIDCDRRNMELFDKLVEGSASIEQTIDLYKKVTAMYLKSYSKKNQGKEYNSMIKEPLDLGEIRDLIEVCSY